MKDAPLHWPQAPSPPIVDGGRRPVWRAVALLVVIGIAGPAAWSVAADQPRATAAIVAVGLAGSLLMRWSHPGRWGLRLLVLLAAITLLAPECGIAVAMWLAAGLLLADWSVSDEPPLPLLPEPGPGAATPVAALCVVAAALAATGNPPLRVAVPFALASVAPVMTRFGGGAMTRIAAAVGHTVATVVSSLAFGVLGALAVVLPWLLQRPVGIDPLHPRREWVARRRRSLRSDQPWATEPDAEDTPGRRRLIRSIVATLVLGLAVWSIPVTRESIRVAIDRTTNSNPFRLDPYLEGNTDRFEIRDRVEPGIDAHEPDPNELQAAMVTSAVWFWEENFYNTAQGWALDPGAAWRPVNPYRLLDFRSRYLNVVDGNRLSWVPPACGCERLTVWMFGGSTAYGLNQRDEHTIASELARVAYEHGITIDIQNKGANGHLHWMEAERFAWDLTVSDPPDLAIFYDGVNESWGGGTLNTMGSGDIHPMVDPTTIDLWTSTGRSDEPAPRGPRGSKLTGRPTGIVLELQDEARVVVERYERARTISRVTGEEHGVQVRYVWQPSRFSRPLIPAEPHAGTDTENRSRLSEQLKASMLPTDVIDVTDALRDNREPLFTDDVHHNERAARLIAEAIYTEIEPDLSALVESRQNTGSPR